VLASKKIFFFGKIDSAWGREELPKLVKSLEVFQRPIIVIFDWDEELAMVLFDKEDFSQAWKSSEKFTSREHSNPDNMWSHKDGFSVIVLDYQNVIDYYTYWLESGWRAFHPISYNIESLFKPTS
jgi:hypothetical protein